MSEKQSATALVAATAERLRDDFIKVSDEIWGHAELRFIEHRSAAAQIAVLEKHGFTIRRQVAGIDTAFIAEKGEEGPIIAFLGEFDALSSMSQEAGASEQKPVKPGATGHGCGHNLLGAGSMLAAVTLTDVARETGHPVRVRYYGCPGEEGGSGKAFMARDGLFDDVDAAFTWHPAPITGARSNENLAVIGVYYKFSGLSSHASHSAHLGRSAVDAMGLMHVGANFLREHVGPNVRMHYAITNGGGSSPNVVQAAAETLFYVRSTDLADVLQVAERLHDVARGAALMTGTTVEITVERGSSNLIPNPVMESVLHNKLMELGPIPFDEADHAYAATLQKTFPPNAVDACLDLYHFSEDAVHNRVDREAPLHTGIRRYEGAPHFRAGSTDVGDVSWVTPTAQCWTATWALGTPGHSWQVVAQGKTPAAHKAMVHAAKTLAAGAAELLMNPAQMEAAKAEWHRRRGGKPYVSPIPEGVQPQPPHEVA